MATDKTDWRELDISPQQRIRRARAKYPDAYALTVNEAIRLHRFDNLIWQFFDTHNEFVKAEFREGDTEKKYPVYRNLYNDKSIAMLRAFFAVKRLSLANASALANRVLSHPWFEVLSVIHREGMPDVAYINTSDDKHGELSRDEWPEFYEVWTNGNDTNALQMRDALKLNDTYLYLCPGERDNLQLIKWIAEYDNTPFSVAQEEGFVIVKSNPQSTALVSVGAKAITDAKYDELTEVYDIMASTGEHVYLRGHKLNGKELVNLDKMVRQINYKLYQMGYSSMIVPITLDEFMQFRELTDRDSARTQFARAIELLYEVSLKFTFGNDKPTEARYLQVKAEISNSKVSLLLSIPFFQSLQATSSLAYIPQGFFKLDGKSDNAYIECEDKAEKKEIWYAILQLLPEGYNQKSTLDFNYENALSIIRQREGHKLTEWATFREYLKDLPIMDLVLEAVNKA